jgi:hypothetical protein
MPKISLLDDNTAFIPWALDHAPTAEDIEWVAGTLRKLLDQNPPGSITRARVSLSRSANGAELQLGCWMHKLLPKLSPIMEVVLEFVDAPQNAEALITTPLSEMPTVKVRVYKKGVELL